MVAVAPNSPLGLFISLASGLVFGFVMNKAKVIDPAIIRDQMVMSRFVMLKLFLTASGTSALVFLLLNQFKKTKGNVLSMITCMGGLMNRGILPFIVGGLLLGIGLDLSGTCPGMVYVEIGAFVQNCHWTMLGCLIGTILYVFLSPYIEKLSTTVNSTPKTLMEVTGLSYNTLALLFAITMYLIVYLVEFFRPWKQDISALSLHTFSLRSYAWSPIACGAIVGLVQLPLMGLLGKMLGSSVSYMTLLAQVYDRHAELKENKHNWWQVFFVTGSVAGSYLASLLYFGKVMVYDTSIHGVKPLYAIGGGICLLLGAKTMRACTSGHGLSGMPLMSVASVIATCCIFGGGILSGFLFNAYI